MRGSPTCPTRPAQPGDTLEGVPKGLYLSAYSVPCRKKPSSPKVICGKGIQVTPPPPPPAYARPPSSGLKLKCLMRLIVDAMESDCVFLQ